jgi:hypothetical protein
MRWRRTSECTLTNVRVEQIEIHNFGCRGNVLLFPSVIAAGITFCRNRHRAIGKCHCGIAISKSLSLSSINVRQHDHLTFGVMLRMRMQRNVRVRWLSLDR